MIYFSTEQYFEVNPKSYVIGQFNEMFSPRTITGTTELRDPVEV